MVDTFARQYARTQRFTLGEPRNITVTSDGRSVLMLRTDSGSDRVTCLWHVDATTGEEHLLADPRSLADDEAHTDLPPAERARRERLREGAAGITAYATDAGGDVIAFAVGGLLGVASVSGGRSAIVDVPGPVVDPRPDPSGRRVAYVRGRSLCVTHLPDDTTDAEGASPETRVLAAEPDDPPTVSWGSADFIAAEEMRRMRGFWWSPDGDRLAVCRVDESAVQLWHLGDAAHPEQTPATIRYPAAGADNADTTLHLVDLDGGMREVVWDRAARPYLAEVHWSRAGLIVAVQSRDQRTLDVLDVDPVTGSTSLRQRDIDPHWVELVPGTPRLDRHGRLITCADRDGARRLMIDGESATPVDLQVRSVVGIVHREDSEEGVDSAPGPDVVVSANPIDDATVLDMWRIVPGRPPERLTAGDGVHGGAMGGSTLVVRRTTLDTEPFTSVLPGALSPDPPQTAAPIALAHRSERPLLNAAPTLHTLTDRHLATAVLLPRDHDGRTPLPVLLDPYAGPHAQRVVRSHHAHLVSQWFADHGFAVVVTDGRGTPGRGSAFERAVAGDLAGPVLDDQIDALDAIADRLGFLDLGRVGIRGWSFGGYLAALAVLARPDRFHAAIAGAPVTDWRLYDTHYTERYLGTPEVDPDAYERTSLLELAPRLQCPLLLIHGLADDNVVAAHTLRLSSALLAAGRVHEVLVLSGVSHMTPQEVIAENLLAHQLDFLRRSLDSPAMSGS